MKPSFRTIALLSAIATSVAAQQSTTPRPHDVRTPMPPTAELSHESLLSTMEPLTPLPPLPPVDVQLAHEPLLSTSVPLTPLPSLSNVAPRPSWAPTDAADSLYRAAREALNRTEYRVAARLFRELRDKHPRSQYAADAAYYEAFCLYRIGTAEDLRAGLDALKRAQAERYSQSSMQADAVSLAARIQGALARRGDPAAKRYIDSLSAGAGTCDREEQEVRVEALSALAQMDDASALPVLRRVLARRDACTAGLRRRAIYLLVRKGDTTALPVLLDVVRSDSESEVRREAVGAIGRVPGPRADQALAEILRDSKDERVQSSAVSAMAQREDWGGLRALIERSDLRVELMVQAIGAINRERFSPEEAAWLRAIYSRAAEHSVKEAIARTIGRLGGETNEQWLVSIARNANEPLRARTAAIESLSRSTVALEELVKIYDAASERNIREHLVRVFASRRESAAIDKLIDIVRTGTDPVVRRSAISHLTRHKDDPRVAKLFLELIDR